MATTAKRKAVDQGYGRTSRAYEIPGGYCFDSVTSILGVIAKPALINWAANKERELVTEAAADFYADIPLDAPRMARPAFLASLSARLGSTKAHQRELEKAGNIGSQAHALIEWNLRRELGQVPGPQPEVSDASLRAFACYEEWRRESELTPRLIEQVVWSREHEYAGTLDLFGVARCMRQGADGELVNVVVDWKTGKAIYPEAFMQSAAYIRALTEMGHVDGPVWGLVVRLPKVEADPDFEVAWVSPDEQREHFDAFMSAKRLWDWTQRRRLEKSDVKD